MSSTPTAQPPADSAAAERPASASSTKQTAAERAAARAARREANRARWAEAKAERATKGKARQAEREAKAEKAATRAARPLTDDQQAAFLELFAAGLTVSDAAARVGASSSAVFRRVREDDEFRTSFFSARETNTDHAEDALTKLAHEGNVQALLAVLRARRPAVWREHRGLTVEEGEATRQQRNAVFLELVSALSSLASLPGEREPKIRQDEAQPALKPN